MRKVAKATIISFIALLILQIGLNTALSQGVIDIPIPTSTPTETPIPLLPPPPLPEVSPTPRPAATPTPYDPTTILPVITPPVVSTREPEKPQTIPSPLPSPLPPPPLPTIVIPTVVVDISQYISPTPKALDSLLVRGRVCVTTAEICDERSEGVQNVSVFYQTDAGTIAFTLTDVRGQFEVTTVKGSFISILAPPNLFGAQVRPASERVDFPLRTIDERQASFPIVAPIPVVMQNVQSGLMLLLLGVVILLLVLTLRSVYASEKAVRSLNYLAYRLTFKPTDKDEFTLLQELKQLLIAQNIPVPLEAKLSAIALSPTSPLFSISSTTITLYLGTVESVREEITRKKQKAKLRVIDSNITLPLNDIITLILRLYGVNEEVRVPQWAYALVKLDKYS